MSIFRIDGRKYYNFLKTHISDKTYIGTKYSKNSYKDGANGFSGWVNSAGAGMDCEGFIDNVLKQCGASHPMSVGGGGKGWAAYNNHYGLPYYDYSSKADMLASGILDYGDIIWMFDTSSRIVSVQFTILASLLVLIRMKINYGIQHSL